MPEALKVALIGVKPDGVPAVHLRSIAKLQEEGLVKLVAVAEKNTDNEAIAKLVGSKVIGGVHVYRDYREMFNKETIDIVTIATPHQFHWPMARYALEKGTSSEGKGVNVFCEKPPAVLIQDANEFLAIANRSGRQVAVNCMYTASESARELRQLLKQGVIGNIESIVGVGKWCRTNEYYTGRPWAGKKMVGTDYVLDGAMLNQFPHLFRQCLFFTGKDELKVDNVLAELYRAHNPAILEMEGTGCLRTNVSGVNVLMYFTTSYDHDDALTVEVRGTKGTAKWTCDIFGPEKQTKYEINFKDDRPQRESIWRNENWGYMCLGLFRNYVDLVRGKTKENYSPLEPAVLHVSVVNGAYISSSSDEPAIQQIGDRYIEYRTEAVGASGTGQTAKGKETKVLIKNIGETMDYAAQSCVMFSAISYAPWARASKRQVNTSTLAYFDPEGLLL